ncbi:MAG: type II toxin-antitoxin system VapC family toxin [Alphaproteobacteria bacterium]|nr:type II toxin-antitoxin system VapC family toxin [Alphaproteobacteria bacterium]
MIVVDASALLETLVGTSAKQTVGDRLAEAGTLHAPHLIDLEAAQVLRRLVAARSISLAAGEEALVRLSSVRLLRHPHDYLLPRVWELRHNMTAYDAVYVALAEFLAAPLLTRDRRLASAPGHSARIDLV